MQKYGSLGKELPEMKSKAADQSNNFIAKTLHAEMPEELLEDSKTGMAPRGTKGNFK